MDRDAADRIAAAAERDPGAPTALSGFDERAAAAAHATNPAKDDDED